MNNLIKNMAIWLVIALILMTVFNQFSVRQQTQVPIDYSQFITELNQGRIAKVTIDGRTLRGIKSDGRRFTTYAPSDPWLVSDLLKSGVVIEAKPEEEPSLLMSIFISWFPMLLLIAVWVFSCGKCRVGGGMVERSRLEKARRECWISHRIMLHLMMWPAVKKRRKRLQNW